MIRTVGPGPALIDPAPFPEPPEVLGRCRDLIAPALEEAAERLAPEVRQFVLYHMGLADSEGRPVAGFGGKAVRPALAILSAEVAGAPPATGVPGAIAVQLIHDFSLLHDDVMDEDATRRHRPTTWAQFGIGPAILAGDALVALAVQVLLESAEPAGLAAARVLLQATQRMIAGQAEDLALESLASVTPAEYLAMAEGKTGALMACAASIGAILAGAAEPVIAALADFGRHLGLAFQAVDDLLGIWGSPEITGKPVGGDLLQHKKTLPIAAALEADGFHEDRLATLLRSDLGGDSLAEAAGLIESLGGRARAVTEADRHLALAFEALERNAVAGRVRDELGRVASFVTAREW